MLCAPVVLWVLNLSSTLRATAALDVLVAAWHTVRAYMRLWRELLRRQRRCFPDPNDRRVVLFASSFPPDISGGVYRPASLARYGTRKGWLMTVVTVAPPTKPSAAGERLFEYVGAGTEVIRLGEPTLRPSYRLFERVDGNMMIALDLVRTVRDRFKDALPQTIIGSGPSFSTFIAAYLLARSSSSRLVLEYRDEWTACPFDFVSKTTLDAKWERRCLRRADQIVVTTCSQKAELGRRFGAAIASRCDVISNGWEPAGTDSTLDQKKKERTEILLTFAGRLGGHADPTRFLATLARIMLRRQDLRTILKVRFVGAKDPTVLDALDRFPFSDILESLALVPLSEAKRMMRESNALLLFHNKAFERYIPGKIYEYAASRVKVILFDDSGETSRLIAKLGLGHNVRSDDEHTFEAILDELVAQRTSATPLDPSAPLDEWLEQHTRESLADDFFALLTR